MGRLYIMVAFLLLFTASWTSAGTLDVLSDAVAIRAPDPRSPAPGAVVKAEFKSTLDSDAELSLDSDEPGPAPKSRRIRPNVKPKPAVAFKKKNKKAGSTAEKREEASPQAAQKGVNDDALELDLEKDLVLSPPPPKTEDELEVSPRAPAARPPGRPAKAKPKTREAVKPQAKPKDRAGLKETPIEQQTLTRTVRKVRPLTSDPWSTPAGSYAVRPFHGAPDSVVPPSSHTAAPAQPPKAYLRQGVMVRLTPQPGSVEPPQQSGGLGTGTELLNSALDLIGLPFAFISSMF